jgi:hypothetical protein
LIEQEGLAGAAYAHQYIVTEFPDADAAGNDFLARHFHLVVGQNSLDKFLVHGFLFY